MLGFREKGGHMVSYSFEKREISLLRLFVKACVLRLLREQGSDRKIPVNLNAVLVAIKIDLAFQARTSLDRPLLLLFGACLNQILKGTGTLSKEEWEKHINEQLFEIAQVWKEVSVEL